MPKYKLSIVGVGGRTLAEGITEKVGRNHAITEGLVEILQAPECPPEAADFVASAWARGTDINDQMLVQDMLIEKWGLQFFCDEVKDLPVQEPVPQAPPRLTAPPAPMLPQPAPVPPANDRTPRQILQDELKRLTKEMTALRGQKALIDRKFNNLKSRREECERLLHPPTTAPKRRGRPPLHPVNGVAAHAE